MRSAVVLPQPDGPSSTMNSPSCDREGELVDRGHLAEALGDPVEHDLAHARSCVDRRDGRPAVADGRCPPGTPGDPTGSSRWRQGSRRVAAAGTTLPGRTALLPAAGRHSPPRPARPTCRGRPAGMASSAAAVGETTPTAAAVGGDAGQGGEPVAIAVDDGEEVGAPLLGGVEVEHRGADRVEAAHGGLAAEAFEQVARREGEAGRRRPGLRGAAVEPREEGHGRAGGGQHLGGGQPGLGPAVEVTDAASRRRRPSRCGCPRSRRAPGRRRHRGRRGHRSGGPAPPAPSAGRRPAARGR